MENPERTFSFLPPITTIYNHLQPFTTITTIPSVYLLPSLTRPKAFRGPVNLLSTSSAVLGKRRKMPPKKAPAPEKKILLGRPSNNLKIGIVGTSSPFVFLTLHSSRFL